MNEKKVELSYRKFEWFIREDFFRLTQYFKTREGERFRVNSQFYDITTKALFTVFIFSNEHGWIEYLKTDRDFKGANLNVNEVYEKIKKRYGKDYDQKKQGDEYKKEVLDLYLKNSHPHILKLIKDI
ncbi:MAG: hypothetical protein CL760_11840 [Chloroflexi bacterium]|nr:hypothetical protein [Chloroflexota bacterium]|tara:strand:+ start:63851 stop:64231 length:381 start_codon:yes stop_codon:yes gene_type:complete